MGSMRGMIQMKKTSKKYIIFFQTNSVLVYQLVRKKPVLKIKKQLFFNETLVHDEMLGKIRKFLKGFKEDFGELDNECVRIFASGIFQELSKEEQKQVVIDVFVRFGVLFNIIDSSLEAFYKQIGEGDVVEGLCRQEFRKVVICGSFQQNLKEIKRLMDVCHKKNIEVLSPWTVDVVPETIGTDFILLEGQELFNKRDSWRHKFDHMQKFIKADAIIVCNPDGVIGKGTMFEFGFMVAHNKRIIFTNEPKGMTIHFPYEIGVNL